jgi:hypothetical protein
VQGLPHDSAVASAACAAVQAIAGDADSAARVAARGALDFIVHFALAPLRDNPAVAEAGLRAIAVVLGAARTQLLARPHLVDAAQAVSDVVAANADSAAIVVRHPPLCSPFATTAQPSAPSRSC